MRYRIVFENGIYYVEREQTVFFFFKSWDRVFSLISDCSFKTPAGAIVFMNELKEIDKKKPKTVFYEDVK